MCKVASLPGRKGKDCFVGAQSSPGVFNVIELICVIGYSVKGLVEGGELGYVARYGWFGFVGRGGSTEGDDGRGVVTNLILEHGVRVGADFNRRVHLYELPSGGGKIDPIESGHGLIGFVILRGEWLGEFSEVSQGGKS